MGPSSAAVIGLNIYIQLRDYIEMEGVTRRGRGVPLDSAKRIAIGI